MLLHCAYTALENVLTRQFQVFWSHTKGRQLQVFNEVYQEKDSEVIANKPHWVEVCCLLILRHFWRKWVGTFSFSLFLEEGNVKVIRRWQVERNRWLWEGSANGSESVWKWLNDKSLVLLHSRELFWFHFSIFIATSKKPIENELLETCNLNTKGISIKSKLFFLKITCCQGWLQLHYLFYFSLVFILMLEINLDSYSG